VVRRDSNLRPAFRSKFCVTQALSRAPNHKKCKHPPFPADSCRWLLPRSLAQLRCGMSNNRGSGSPGRSRRARITGNRENSGCHLCPLRTFPQESNHDISRHARLDYEFNLSNRFRMPQRPPQHQPTEEMQQRVAFRGRGDEDVRGQGACLHETQLRLARERL
jgi:hypothetical protein